MSSNSRRQRQQNFASLVKSKSNFPIIQLCTICRRRCVSSLSFVRSIRLLNEYLFDDVNAHRINELYFFVREFTVDEWFFVRILIQFSAAARNK